MYEHAGFSLQAACVVAIWALYSYVVGFLVNIDIYVKASSLPIQLAHIYEFFPIICVVVLCCYRIV